MRIADIGEFGLIERIARVVGAAPEGVVAGIGDDTAIIDTGGARLLLATIDIQVEGRHFLRGRTTPYQLGRRTAAINLSDIGAMGGEPRWALVSLALPQDLDVAWVDELYRGLRDELGRFGAAVIGGNLSGGGEIVLDLALLGEVERGRVLRRAGACPGDAVLVTGDLGASAAGRYALDAGLEAADPSVAACIARHLTPAPRVKEGRTIAAHGLATAMLDLSDGLASDLGHLCDVSGVGVEIDRARLPIAAHTRTVAARLDRDLLHLALAGGEDYELLFTAPPEAVDHLIAAVADSTGTSVTVIGRIITADTGRWLVDASRRLPLRAAGWDHFRDR
jgi:thiamine-monophosphate kinase